MENVFNEEVPRGVFSLGRAGEPADPSVLSNPAVDGISIRRRWVDLEPSKGAFDWRFLDEEISRAEKAGKKVLVRIQTLPLKCFGSSTMIQLAATTAGK